MTQIRLNIFNVISSSKRIHCFVLRSSLGEIAGIALLGMLLLLLLQCGLDLFANIHGDFQSFSLAVNRENDLLAYATKLTNSVLVMALPSTAVITSPLCRPALAAGPFSVTD